MDWQLLGLSFITVFLSELGDKSQLAAIALGSSCNSPRAVFFGTASALLLASLIGVAHRLQHGRGVAGTTGKGDRSDRICGDGLAPAVAKSRFTVRIRVGRALSRSVFGPVRKLDCIVISNWLASELFRSLFSLSA